MGVCRGEESVWVGKGSKGFERVQACSSVFKRVQACSSGSNKRVEVDDDSADDALGLRRYALLDHHTYYWPESKGISGH